MNDISPRRRRSALWRDPATALACLLLLAVVAGGGGVNAAFGNLAVQLCALLVLAVHASSVKCFVRDGPRGLACLVAASCLLPLMQLVPLPPQVWPSLPGRDLIAQSLDLSGGLGWFPVSVAPGRTLVAFLGTLAPVAIVAVGWTLPPARLVMLQHLLIALGIAVALFGTLHLLDADWGDLYAEMRPLPGVIVGTFADRNAAALFLDICILLLVGLPTFPPRLQIVSVLVGSFLAVCVVLTGSRSGIVLLGAAALLFAWRMVASRHAISRARMGWFMCGATAVILAAVAVTASGRGQTSLARFYDDDGMRAEMREDARFAAVRYWPVGAGMGAFDEVFQIDESLEYVSPRTAGRAHMDYLEVAIEAGVAGVALVAAWLGWLAWFGSRAIRGRDVWPARAAALGLAIIALQSILAFPLRSQAMLCVAGLLIVLLARSPVAAPGELPDA